MNAFDDLINNSIAAHRAGDYVSAANGYASALKQDPKHADAWHLAGLLAHQLGKHVDGIMQIEMAINLNPTNPEYFSNLAAILTSIQQLQAALAAADRAIEIDANFGPGLYQKGIALSRLGRLELAIESFEMAIKHGADAANALNEIANLHQYMGNIPAAIECIERSLKSKPRNPHAYFQLSKFVTTGVYTNSNQQIANIEIMLAESQRSAVDRN